MEKYWETMFNCESTDGTWETTKNDEKKEIFFTFWNYESQRSLDEKLKEKIIMRLTYEQYTDLLNFATRMNKSVRKKKNGKVIS